jgi:hypothetical protein
VEYQGVFPIFAKPFSVVRKFFPLDKNYLLEEAQLQLRDSLLENLVEKVKDQYFLRYNPLGLEDSLSLRVDRFKMKNKKALYNFYENLAGIYRYKFGENQLEFLWDGVDHVDKYKGDWSNTFDKWTTAYCAHDLFIKAVLDLTVFLEGNRNAQLAESRMNHFILQHFEVRIHKQRGILAMKVA